MFHGGRELIFCWTRNFSVSETSVSSHGVSVAAGFAVWPLDAQRKRKNVTNGADKFRTIGVVMLCGFHGKDCGFTRRR